MVVLKLKPSATAVQESPAPNGLLDAEFDDMRADLHAPKECASASRSSPHQTSSATQRASSFQRAVTSVAAVKSLLAVVRREIEDEAAAADEEHRPGPSRDSWEAALRVAGHIADRIHAKPWIDLAAFVEDDGRVGVLAHSSELGRRITVYCGNSDMRVIQTGVSGKPTWLELTTESEVRDALAWVDPD